MTSFTHPGLHGGPFRGPLSPEPVDAQDALEMCEQHLDLPGHRFQFDVGRHVIPAQYGRVGPGNCTLSPSQIPYVNLSIHTARVTA